MPGDTLIRRFVKATITETEFLKGIRQIWRPDLAPPHWLWVADRSFEFLDRYGKAPGRDLEVIWAAEPNQDPETGERLREFFQELSDQYETVSCDINHLLERARDWFENEDGQNFSAQYDEARAAKDGEGARKLLQDHHVYVEKVRSCSHYQISAIDPADHPDRIKAAFEAGQSSLVSLGGALQEGVGEQIVPNSFVGFVGKEKSGKTWMKQELSFAGLRAGSNVYVCTVGDMSEGQCIVRQAIQITGRNTKARYNGEVLSPIPDCLLNQLDKCEFDDREGHGRAVKDEEQKPYPKLFQFDTLPEGGYSPCSRLDCPRFQMSTWWERIYPCPDLKWEDAYESWSRFRNSTGDRLRMDTFPKGGISVAGISSMLSRMEDSTGWKPDIVIVDYADNLDPEPNASKEFRHQENDRWGAFRKLSQDRNISVITFTQAPKATRGRLLRDTDMSEDKRKKAHVTAFFGINKDVHDKRRGWIRVNPLVVREDDFDTEDQVAVLQLLQRGRPNLSSHWIWRNGR